VLKVDAVQTTDRLFFINLGGYQAGKLEEQHYVILTVQKDRAAAIKEAKKAAFFQTNTVAKVKGANAHIDDKYGIDVDDIYQINEMLTPAQKVKYHIQLTPAADLPADEIHLGYFRLDKL
jgi:LysM repeat protein